MIKNTSFTKKHYYCLYSRLCTKANLHTVKMPRKYFAMTTIDIVLLAHCKPETRKTGDSSNSCVCLYRSLELSTDDQV